MSAAARLLNPPFVNGIAFPRCRAAIAALAGAGRGLPAVAVDCLAAGPTEVKAELPAAYSSSNSSSSGFRSAAQSLGARRGLPLLLGLGNGDVALLAPPSQLGAFDLLAGGPFGAASAVASPSSAATAATAAAAAATVAAEAGPVELCRLRGHNHAVVAVEYAAFGCACAHPSPAAAGMATSPSHACAAGSCGDVAVTLSLDSRAVVWSGLRAAAARGARRARARIDASAVIGAVARATSPSSSVATPMSASAKKNAKRKAKAKAVKLLRAAEDDVDDDVDADEADPADDPEAADDDDAGDVAGPRAVRGMYSPLDKFESETYSVGQMRARVPLRGRPNGGATDASGWLWVCDAEADFYGIHIAHS